MHQDAEGPLHVVPLVGRCPLAFELLHREPLYLHAVRAIGLVPDADPVVAAPLEHVERVSADVERAVLPVRVLPDDEWWDLASRSAPPSLLVHDPLCPLVPAEFLAAVCRRAGEQRGTSFVAFRPVTDTVKTAVDGRIQGTIDRENLAALTSPVLIAGAVLSASVRAGDPPPVSDFAGLVAWIRARGPLELVAAPVLGGRVDGASAVNLLECVDELGRQRRVGPTQPGTEGPLSGVRRSRTP